MRLIMFLLKYSLSILVLLSFFSLETYSQRRFAKIEGGYVVIYEAPSMQFSEKDIRSFIVVDRILRQQFISYRNVDEAIGRMIETGYQIRSIASLFLPYIERYSNLIGVGAPGLFSLQFGYTNEYGFGLYYYPESALGYSLYNEFIQKYRMMTGDIKQIYLMNSGQYNKEQIWKRKDPAKF